MARSIDVILHTDIKKPLPEVGEYLMDWRNDPQWIGGVSSSNMLTPAPLGVGSRILRTASFLGKQFPYETEVAEYVPQQRIVMKADKPFEMMVSYVLEPIDGGTRVTVRNQGEASGFFRLAAPLLAKNMTKNISGDLVRLKQILESR